MYKLLDLFMCLLKILNILNQKKKTFISSILEPSPLSIEHTHKQNYQQLWLNPRMSKDQMNQT